MIYRTLGRTNLKASVISLGGGAFYNPKATHERVTNIINYCFIQGINLIDTAKDYDETKLREGLKDIRDKLILTSKSPSSTKEMMKSDIHNSLKKVCTDFIDIYQMQTITTVDELKNRIRDGALDALKEAKEQGKINFIGFSSHRIPTIIEAIRTNEFDVVEMPYSIAQYKSEKAIKVAKKYNVGVIAINVLGGGILVDREKISKAASFMTTKNALHYVLSNKNIATALVGMSSLEHVKENITNTNHLKMLSNSERRINENNVYKFLGNDFCRSCKACMPCDVYGWQFSIDNFLRFHTYFCKYGYKNYINEYQKLPLKADKCTQCGKCEERCPYGVKIREELKKVHKELNLHINQEQFKKLIKSYFSEKLVDTNLLKEVVYYYIQLGREQAADKINSLFMPMRDISKSYETKKREEIGRTLLAGIFYLTKSQFLNILKPYVGELFIYKNLIKKKYLH